MTPEILEKRAASAPAHKGMQETGAESDDLSWFLAQFDTLVSEFPDHWLAIYRQQVVAEAATPGELREKVARLSIDRPLIVRSHPDAWTGVK